MRAIVLGLFVVACGKTTLLDTHPGADAEARARSFAGPNAIRCGRAREHDAALDACIVQAFEAKKPFYALIEMQGVDSAVGDAIGSNGTGTVRRFGYDDYAKRSSGASVSIHQLPCDAPAVVDAGGHRALDCERTTSFK